MRRHILATLVLGVQVYANLQQIELFHYHLKIFKDAFDDSRPHTSEDLLTLTTSPVTSESDDGDISVKLIEGKFLEPLLSSGFDSELADPEDPPWNTPQNTEIKKLVLDENLKSQDPIENETVLQNENEYHSEAEPGNDLDDDLDGDPEVLDESHNNEETPLSNRYTAQGIAKNNTEFSKVSVEAPSVSHRQPHAQEVRATSNAEGKTRKSHHKGLREVSTMKPGYYEVPLRLVHKNKNNEYRDPELSDAPTKAPLPTQYKNSGSIQTSSKLELLDRISDLEASETKQAQNPTNTQPVREYEPPPEVPLATGGYVTNYVDDSGYIRPPSYELPKKPKKAKWVYMEGIVNANEHQESNLNLKTKNENKETDAQAKNAAVSLESLIESDPTLQRRPDETTTAYFERVYPKIKEIMERDNKGNSKNKFQKASFFWNVLRRLRRPKSSSAEEEPPRSLIFKSVFNMTMFKSCFEPSESAASLPMESVSSIAGAVVVILILSM